MTLTFLQMADLHLAWPFTGLPERISRLRRAELRAALVRLVDLALAERVDLVLIAGDLYEHTHADRPLATFVAEQLARLDPIPVLVSPGNHDPILPGSYWDSFPWPPNVHRFGPVPERVDLDQLNLSVWGWGFGSWEVHQFQLGGIRRAPGRINLGLFHGGGAPYHPFGIPELEALGLDYVAIGHIHKPGPLIGRDGQLLAWYSGSPEPLSFGEPGEHGVLIGRVEAAEGGRNRVTCRFVPTAARSCLTRSVDLSGISGPEAAAALIGAAFSEQERERDLCRAQLTGRIDPELTLEPAMIEEMLAQAFLHLRVEDQTEPDWDLEAIAREKSVRGLFVERLQRLAAGADEQEGARIRRALHLGLTALAKGEGAR